MKNRCWTMILALSVWMGALSAQAPHLLPEARATEICNAKCQAQLIDDPVQKSLIDRLVFWIRHAMDTGGDKLADIQHILHDLCVYLLSIGDQYHNQVASSQCKDRICSGPPERHP